MVEESNAAKKGKKSSREKERVREEEDSSQDAVFKVALTLEGGMRILCCTIVTISTQCA